VSYSDTLNEEMGGWGDLTTLTKILALAFSEGWPNRPFHHGLHVFHLRQGGVTSTQDMIPQSKQDTQHCQHCHRPLRSRASKLQRKKGRSL